MADSVRQRVASGAYATESEAIRHALRSLAARDRAIDAWLRETVVPAADVRASLAKRRTSSR
ncbi:hypothetical protein WJ47_21565 [Burkholderia ubonensis]|uniref:CopG family transcriptional regulator n=1 Tax=Burkholderia ubonensis TaxID=101571 RepID=A0AB73FU78_9BURK|nr:hypothetical protein [Burkholderia ubonensis]KVK83869.1 hypothetical protein WJ44_06365 [Burkholderia ubonensis]KVL82909.1 hypothetical protein WJ47_21565 [Burkholderia ubonensis]KVM23906.1 hypothetical protein WJ53_17405 [Burkholderia ubonensis]KVM35410.1 hypothetical protein WJ54_35780 [Burkholderia ubonensis]